MLGYFALITFIKLSGLLVAYAWFMAISDKLGRKLATGAIVLLFIVSYINIYFNLPDLAYPALIDEWLMWFVGGMALTYALKKMLYTAKTEATEVQKNGFLARLVAEFTQKFGWVGKLGLVAALFMGIFFILSSVSAIVTQVNPKPAVNSIKTELNNDTSKAPMPVINGNETPVVNAPQTVSTDMNNSLNSFRNSNVYDLNHMRVQMFKGKMVYVAPVEFSGGFWRYIHYQKVPGYFMTNATDKDADPKFISRPMKYTPSAYFNNDADRRISAHSLGYTMVGNTSQLEVDDKGTPYYVRTLAKPLSYFNRNYDYKHYKVAVLNTITGKVNVYSPNNVPKFVDVAVAPELVTQEVSLFGKYRNGFWNSTSIGGHKDVMKPTTAGTEGNDRLTPYAFNGRIYYFTGMTSVNEHQSSILGYVFVDARTNTLHYYREHGNVMTPERAISYAQQDINPQNYKGTLPLLYRINKQPTWVVSMLDRDNNSFMKYVYLLADGNNQSNTYAIGNDAQSTLNQFNQRLSLKSGIKIDTKTEKAIKGEVLRVARVNDDTMLVMLKNQSQVFKINTSSKLFKPEFNFLQPGDKISFRAPMSKDVKVSLVEIDLGTLKNQSLPK